MSVIAAEANDNNPTMKRTVRPDAPTYILTNFTHPYSKKGNKFLWALCNLLKCLKPETIDTELAWAHALSRGELKSVPLNDPTGQVNRYLDDNYGDIKKDIYLNIANWILVATKLFDRSQFKADNDYNTDNSTDKYYNETRLGYTIHLPSATQTTLAELVKSVTTLTFERECELNVLEYQLDMAMISVKDAYRREAKLMDDLIRVDSLHHKEPLTGETKLVIDYTEPLLSLIKTDALSCTDGDINGMVDALSKRRLKIYATVLQLLCCLRNVKQEKTQYKCINPWGYQDDAIDPYETRSFEIPYEKWIDHLPSYRPEFVITLKTRQEFSYTGHHVDPISTCCPSLAYLRALCSFI